MWGTVRARLLPFTIGFVALCGSAWGGYIENRSYGTLCAEVDNINIPLYASGVTAYRIVATHPAYYPTSIDERGHDFTDCDFADRQIWLIGEKNGLSTGFRDSGLSDPEVHYVQDNPPAGVDEHWTNFPREINHDWMNNQYIVFTADEPGDFNHTLIIGAWLDVAFASVNGTLEIEMRTGDGTSWVSRGTRVFDSGNPVRRWDIPDFTWIEGPDANQIHLRVLKDFESASTSGAYGLYNYLELHKRDEAGESVVSLYNDGTNIVQGIHIDFWWRAPRVMTIHVDGGNSMTNAHYLRLIRRLAGSVPAHYDEIFILYQDANARIHPYAPEGLDPNWVPYGASVQIGATPESERPYTDIETVWVDPHTGRVEIDYEDASSAEVRLRVDREQSIVDVRHVTYDTVTLPFTRFRSMWVRDGNDDIQRVLHRLGQFPIMDQWDELEGTWWFFHREAPSYHNTYAPDFLIEILEPSPAFLTRAAETPDDSQNAVTLANAHAFTGEVLSIPSSGGEAEYDLELVRPWLNVFMRLEYADAAGGTPVKVFLNDVDVYAWNAAACGNTNNFVISPNIPLGDLAAGLHTIRIEAAAGPAGISLDRFEWVSRPEPLIEETLIAEIEHQSIPSLLNASFESGTDTTVIDNWTRWDGLTREDWAARTGSWGAMMQGWTTGGGMFQDVASSSEGVEYTFSIWANPTENWQFDHFDVSIFIQFRDGSDQLIQEYGISEADLTGPVNSWSPYSVEGTSPTGTEVVRVGMEFGNVAVAGAGALRFDDALLNDGPMSFELAQSYSNVYLTVRYAEDNPPHRVDIYIDEALRAAFPTEDTGGSEIYAWGPPLYVGDLVAGTNTIDFASSGLKMDRFQLFTRHRINRAPHLEVPSPHTVVMGAETNFMVLAYDLDGDGLAVANTQAPAGAAFDSFEFTWQALPWYGGTTQQVVFVAYDPHGETNSWVTNTAWIVIPYDHDEDGLPDNWEWYYFTSLEHGPDDDVDDDGMTNLEHLIAGTNPNDINSVFAIQVMDGNMPIAERTITVPTQPGRLYTIYYSDSAMSNDMMWQPFADTSDGVGTWFETNTVASTFTFTDDEGPDTTSGPSAEGVRIYRITVQWPAP